MNILAIIGAAIGLALLTTTVILGNKIQNRFLRYLAALIGIIISMTVAGYIPVVLGDSSIATASKSGEYMGYLVFVFFIIRAIFFRKGKSSSE